MTVIIDIETTPDFDALGRIAPPPTEFDPSKVPLGRIKLESSKKKKIEEAREKWDSLPEDERREAFLKDIIGAKKALLRPHLSKVGGYAIKIKGGAPDIKVSITDEAKELKRISSLLRAAAMSNGRIIGWNIAGFDLPYLRRRCAIKGVDFPDVVSCDRKYPAASSAVVDLMYQWGDPTGQAGLKEVAVAVGLSPSLPEISGVDWWMSTDDERMEYCVWDLSAIENLATSMGHWEDASK